MRRLLGFTLALAVGVGGLAPPLAGLALAAGSAEEEKIEEVIAAVIAAYRAGDYAGMSRYYAPEVTVVPSDYNPPVSGWTRVAESYQQAHANLSGVEMARENTRIVRRGKLAWAVYQWRFAGVMGAESVGAVGHTTLVLEKRDGRWLILHNHTSALLPPRPPTNTPARSPSP